MGSFPKKVVTWAGSTSQTVQLNDQAFGTVGRVVFQVVATGGWDDTIRVSRRIQGADRPPVQVASVPWVRSAYRNEATQADVNSSTDISAAGLYSVFCDGTDVQLEQMDTGSTGSVSILYHGIAG